jgi:Leucine-rich repeat (LRR) protein
MSTLDIDLRRQYNYFGISFETERTMKKTIRIIIPILLALSIIICTAWYLMVYDREFTRDMLIQGARFFEDRGKHETAAWFYELAYQQAANNDAVAIELAEQHKATGNYTKAEYILTNAIADGGGAELFIALSKTYVEQDKLLDAVKLLDTVCHPNSSISDDVKQALSALRPSAPTAMQKPGFYNQYIPVSLQTDKGQLYASTSGAYPSVRSDAYTGPITLAAGENTIHALAVADNGLVSPLAILGYTVGGIVEEIAFADPAIEAEVRKILNVSAESVLLTTDLWKITEFTIPEEASVYSDLRHFLYLESLTLYNGTGGQLNVLSAATKLTKLTITNTSVSAEELAVIGGLPNLQQLTLKGCSLSATAGLEKAVKLTYLDLSENTIRNISSLSALQELQECHLQRNALSDLSALSALPALSTLDVSYNAITDLSPLYSISTLTKLIADGNAIAQLGSIENLRALTDLSLAYNKLANITPLQNCEKLKKLVISNNALTDISVLSKLPALADLDFSHNQVTKLPSFRADSVLIRIDGAHNQLSSLDPLQGLKRLNTVQMDYNQKISSVSKLKDCPVLVLVSVYGTKVKDVSALTAQSIVVHYDPT